MLLEFDSIGIRGKFVFRFDGREIATVGLLLRMALLVCTERSPQQALCRLLSICALSNYCSHQLLPNKTVHILLRHKLQTQEQRATLEIPYAPIGHRESPPSPTHPPP